MVKLRWLLSASEATLFLKTSASPPKLSRDHLILIVVSIPGETITGNMVKLAFQAVSRLYTLTEFTHAFQPGRAPELSDLKTKVNSPPGAVEVNILPSAE